MKHTTFRHVLLAMGAGALFSVAAGGVLGDEIILDEAINDYTPVSQANFNNPPPSMKRGYHTEIVLEESYHDYDGAEAKAFNRYLDGLEQTEIAAFEFGGTGRDETVIPWDLLPLD